MFKEKTKVKKDMSSWCCDVYNLANMIFNNEEEQENYVEFIKGGGKPCKHRYYYAALVLGREEEIINETRNM
jgi:hypothetical protein